MRIITRNFKARAKRYGDWETFRKAQRFIELNPGAPGKIDPRGLHFAHKNVQIDLLYKKFKT